MANVGYMHVCSDVNGQGRWIQVKKDRPLNQVARNDNSIADPFFKTASPNVRSFCASFESTLP